MAHAAQASKQLAPPKSCQAQSHIYCNHAGCRGSRRTSGEPAFNHLASQSALRSGLPWRNAPSGSAAGSASQTRPLNPGQNPSQLRTQTVLNLHPNPSPSGGLENVKLSPRFPISGPNSGPNSIPNSGLNSGPDPDPPKVSPGPTPTVREPSLLGTRGKPASNQSWHGKKKAAGARALAVRERNTERD